MAGSKKYGRHKTRSPSAKLYTLEGRRLKNKVKRAAKHLLLHPKDATTAGIVPIYAKQEKLDNKQQAELLRARRWKRYLLGKV